MKIASILENQKFEKRIAITPEIAKKYISLGLEVLLPENYGSHIGIKDDEYKELFVEAGGHTLDYVESLNDDEEWVQAIINILGETNV